MAIYVVELNDSLCDYPHVRRAYLTKDAAIRAAKRATYKSEGESYWAYVTEVECAWDVNLYGPYLTEDVGPWWQHWTDEFRRARAEREKLKAEVTELRLCLADDAETARLIRDENAELREEIQRWEQLTANIELPEYPVTEFVPKDLERENAKLRELVHQLWASCPVSEKDCESCEHQNSDSYAGCELCDRMRELGVEP